MRGACCFEPNDPLATAVIGGLVTSTLLTLFILHMVYQWMEAWREGNRYNKCLLFEVKLFTLKFMIFFSRQNSRSISFGMLLVAYLASCLLAPWFHQHAGEDHAEVKGDFYHSHVSAVASPAQELEQDHHDLPDGLHLLEGSQLLEKMQAAIAAQFGQIFAPGKYAPKIDFFVSPFVENSPQNSVVKAVLKLPPIQPARDYFALTATGLSPPLA